MGNKTKFDKKKCARCQYHNIGSLGVPVRVHGKVVRIFCDYITATNSSCLRQDMHDTVVDIRGNDYNNCKLFVEGKKLERDVPQISIGPRKI
jgi:hypothetical protein